MAIYWYTIDTSHNWRYIHIFIYIVLTLFHVNITDMKLFALRGLWDTDTCRLWEQKWYIKDHVVPRYTEIVFLYLMQKFVFLWEVQTNVPDLKMNYQKEHLRQSLQTIDRIGYNVCGHDSSPPWLSLVNFPCKVISSPIMCGSSKEKGILCLI